MKNGSLVVVKPLGLEIGPYSIHGRMCYVKWLPVQDENAEYVIKEIVDGLGDKPCASLEEGIVGHTVDGLELYISIDMLREVQPPMEISVSDIIKDLVPKRRTVRVIIDDSHRIPFEDMEEFKREIGL